MQTLFKPVFSLFTHRAMRLGGAALLGAARLAGCGGGGGDATPPADPQPNPPPAPTPAPAPTLSQAQGIWQSAAGAATTVSALVLPNGQLWAVLTSGTGASASTRVLKATLAVQDSSYSATGKRYTLGGDAIAVGSVAVEAQVAEKATLDLNVGTGTDAQRLALAWQARYDTPAQLGELAGNWSATLGAGVVTWAVDAQGAITGSRTTGCTYTGQLSLRPEGKAVVDAQVLEDCAGARTQLNGVATLQERTEATPARLSLVLTTQDEAQAVLLGMVR